MSRPLTERDVRAQRHEACHAVAAYVLFGPAAVGGVRCERGTGTGHTAIASLPDWIHPKLNALNAAVVCLAPLFDGSTPVPGSDDDFATARGCAETAYRYAPEDERGAPEDFEAEWLHRVRLDAEELIKESRFIKLRAALEAALDRKPIMTDLETIAVLRAADQ